MLVTRCHSDVHVSYMFWVRHLFRRRRRRRRLRRLRRRRRRRRLCRLRRLRRRRRRRRPRPRRHNHHASRIFPWLGGGLLLRLLFSLSCVVHCQIMTLRYLARSSHHRAWLISLVVFSCHTNVVTPEIRRSSFGL